MTFRDFAIILVLALLSTLTFQYFFSDRFAKTEQAYSGQMIDVPRVKEQTEPVKYDIDFLDAKATAEPVTTIVDTPCAQFVFSSEGAAINSIAYHHPIDGKPSLVPVFNAHEPMDRAFLLATADHAPLYYHLERHEIGADQEALLYTHQQGNRLISKEFIVDKRSCKVKVRISLKGVDQQHPERLRLTLPSPLVESLGDDTVRGFANDRDAVKVHSDLKKITSNLIWVAPTLFGIDDRYFLHAMVRDSNSFVFRAYFRLEGVQRLTAFFESHPIKDDKTWELTFYLGPKSINAIEAVDGRLEQLLDHGYLSFISRGLLKALNWMEEHVGNYGLAIILLTILMHLALLPFSLRGQRSARQAAEIEKKMQYITQKYKNDPERLQQEREELMRTHMMPNLMNGIITQLPVIVVFFALNRVLYGAVELYGASFLWIPTLSGRDPYYLLSLLMLVVMLASMNTRSSVKTSMSGWVWALAFAGMAATVPAGLALYLVTSSFVRLIETKLYARFGKAR